MARGLEAIDITNLPELCRIVEVVRESREPRLLREGTEDVAILMPVNRRERRRARPRTIEDYQAFLSSAGGWKELVDTEQLKADIAESRRRSSRSPSEL